MANPICDIFDRLEGKKTRVCDEGCKNWKFPHLENACVLSEVFSVQKGEGCFIYEAKESLGKDNTNG